jgi:transaldolase
MDLIRGIGQIYRNYGFKCLVLRPHRNPLHVVDAAKAGAHVATCPSTCRLIKHPLTDIGPGSS